MSIQDTRLRYDFRYFTKRSWGDPLTGNEIIVTPSHLKLIEKLMLNKDTVVVVYRWRGKSTIITQKYSLWRATQHGKSVWIFSATEDLAIDKVRQIKSALESDASLNRYSSKGIHTRTDKEIWLTDKTQLRKDNLWNNIYPVISRIKAVGFDTRSRGLHFDIIICDDIIIEENSLTVDWAPDVNKIANVKKLFNEKVVPMKNPWWAIILIGTPQVWNANDITNSDLLYERCNKKNKQTFILPALNEMDEPTCPELHTKEYLLEQKDSMSGKSWLKEYMLTPIVTGESTVSDENIAQCLNDRETYVNEYIPKPSEIVILGTDYSIIDNKFEAEKKQSAYFALSVIAYDRDTNTRNIKQLFYERWLSFSDQLSKTNKFIQEFRVSVVAMELHWGMRYFMSELQRLLPPHVSIIDATNHGSKFDSYMGLPSLQYLFQKQLINLPNREVSDKEKNGFLIHELKYMKTANHLDLLDSLLRADIVIRKYYYVWSIDEKFNIRKIARDKAQLSDLDMDALSVFGKPDKEKIKQALEAKEKDIIYQNLLNEQNKIIFKDRY